MADGFRILFVLVGAGAAAALIHRSMKSAEAAPPRQPRFPPPPPVPSPSPSGPKMFSPGVEFWRPTLEAQRNGVPIVFLLSWLQAESGGNPCDTGFIGDQDPSDGLFKYEAGIGQQYFQATTRAALDDVASHGVALRTLRAPCRAKTAMRALTDEEREANVRAFLGDVVHARTKTHGQLAAAGINWPESSEDFWMVVKLQHALPCVASSFLTPAAAAGQAGSFAQFKTFVNSLPRDQYTRFTTAVGCGKSMAGREKRTAHAMDNAEHVGKGAGL